VAHYLGGEQKSTSPGEVVQIISRAERSARSAVLKTKTIILQCLPKKKRYASSLKNRWRRSNVEPRMIGEIERRPFDRGLVRFAKGVSGGKGKGRKGGNGSRLTIKPSESPPLGKKEKREGN